MHLVRIIHKHQFIEPASYYKIHHKLFNHSIFNDSSINVETISQVTSMMSQTKTSTSE